MKDIIKKFWFSDWTLTEKCLLAADLLLAGVLIGWMTSPFKGGFFSNNTWDIKSGNREEKNVEEEEI